MTVAWAENEKELPAEQPTEVTATNSLLWVLFYKLHHPKLNRTECIKNEQWLCPNIILLCLGASGMHRYRTAWDAWSSTFNATWKRHGMAHCSVAKEWRTAIAWLWGGWHDKHCRLCSRPCKQPTVRAILGSDNNCVAVAAQNSSNGEWDGLIWAAQ